VFHGRVALKEGMVNLFGAWVLSDYAALIRRDICVRHSVRAEYVQLSRHFGVINPTITYSTPSARLRSSRQSVFSASPLSTNGRIAAKGVSRAPSATAAAPRLRVRSPSRPTSGSFRRPDTTNGMRSANRLLSLGFA